MPLRLGLMLPVQESFDLGRDIPRVARAAEQIGYDSLWAAERVLVPEAPADGFFGAGGQPWPAFYRGNAHPLVALTLAAAVTERIELGTSVLIAGLHQPVQLARALATLDNASGGRVVAGLGTGWSRDEYAAAGVVPFAKRGAALEETLDICAAVWGADPVSHAGALSVIAPSAVGPKPARPIPVLLAGATPAAYRRIADRADGWLPAASSPAALAGQWQQLQSVAAQRGRQRPVAISLGARMTITAAAVSDRDRPPLRGSADQVARGAAEFIRAAPVTELVVSLTGSSTDAAQLADTAAALHAALRAAGL
jgi:probable F420-dependent oxidoreductase